MSATVIVDLANRRLIRDDTKTIDKLEKAARLMLATALDSLDAGKPWLAERCATAALDLLRPTLPQVTSEAPESGRSREDAAATAPLPFTQDHH